MNDVQKAMYIYICIRKEKRACVLECDDTNMADLNDSDKMLYIDLFSFCLGFITAV